MAQIIMAERVAAPDTPSTGKVAIYVRDGAYYTKNAAGVETPLQGADGADGADGGSPGLVLLATATASNVTSVDFTSGINSTYDEYQVYFYNVLPVTESLFKARTSSNGGTSFDSGSEDYDIANPTYNGTSVIAIDSMWISNITIGNSSNESGATGVFHIFQPSVSHYVRMKASIVAVNSSGFLTNSYDWVAHRKAASIVNAVRFFFNTSNIASGEFKLYGLRKSL